MSKQPCLTTDKIEDNANQVSDRAQEPEAKYTALEDGFTLLGSIEYIYSVCLFNFCHHGFSTSTLDHFSSCSHNVQVNSSASGKLFTAVLSLQHSVLIYSDRFSRLLSAAGALRPHPPARSPARPHAWCPLPLSTDRTTDLHVRNFCLASTKGSDPRTSLNHPIGSSDGRCGQRAGT